MEQELKQRMIGVTIIVALAVIFVPMLFDKRDDKARAVKGVPSIPDNVMETQLELPKTADDLAPKDEKPVDQSGYKIIPLTETPAEKGDAKPAQAEQKRAPLSATEELSAPTGEEEFGVAEEEKDVEKPRKEGPPKVQPAPPASKPIKSTVVEKPVEAVKKPKVSEIPAKKAEAVTTPATKVEAVPQPVKKPKPAEIPAVQSKPESPATVARPVAPKSGVAATAAPKPAPAEPPAKQPTQAPARPVAESAAANDVWVIQTGSFTSEAKARALADKLRQSRFPAFVESANSEHGPTYRVQVGPELDRARAEQVQKQIESSAGIKGIIVPHP